MDFSHLIFYFFIIIPSAILHEYAHGWMADRLGDPTARYAGRLTLNPKSHIDPFGTILLPLILSFTGFLFAYAKPVPYNPYNLKDQKWGPVWVGLAGPAANFLLAIAFGLLIQMMGNTPLVEFLWIIVYGNVLLGVFNLVPIPPLDGSKVLLAVIPDSLWQLKQALQQYGIILLVAFVLWGSHIISPVIVRLTLLFTGGIGF